MWENQDYLSRTRPADSATVPSNERHLDILKAGAARDHNQKQVQIGTDWTLDALKLLPL